MTGALRPGRPGDGAALAALARDALAEPWSEAALGRVLETGTDRVVVWEEPPGRIAGYAVARLAPGEVEVHQVAVRAGARRTGRGRALLGAVLEAARAAGAQAAHLEVRAGAAPARAFYRAAGFREIGRRARYYRDGEDAIVMSRSLAPLRVDARVVANGAEGAARRLALHVPGWPGHAPGQFVMLSPGARAEVARWDPLLPRPMAVYRARPEDDGAVVEVLYKVVGRGTALLADAAPGDAVRVVGPLGRGFAPPAAGAHAVLVGGGTGIASLLDLAAQVSRRGRATVLLGGRTARDLMGRDDFAALDAELRVATEDGSEGHAGLVTGLLDAVLDADPAAAVYACGPTPMMRAAAELARQRGASCTVSLENPMACGFGVCLGCAVPLAAGGFALVCRDGPVLDADAVAWEALG